MCLLHMFFQGVPRTFGQDCSFAPNKVPVNCCKDKFPGIVNKKRFPRLKSFQTSFICISFMVVPRPQSSSQHAQHGSGGERGDGMPLIPIDTII